MSPRKKKTVYRSKFEGEIAQQLKKKKVEYSYEPSWGKLSYTIPAKDALYTPDFYITTKSGKQIIIEAKGIWDFQDRHKHLLLRRKYPDLDIRFVFYNSKNKIRKGSKTTYRDICEGKGRGMFKGICWKYSDKKIPQDWLME